MKRWGRNLLALALGLAALLLLYQIGLFGMVLWYKYANPGATPIMQQTIRELRASGQDATLDYRWVDYEDISESLKRAVIAGEDSGFTRHAGIEWQAIRDAWEFNREQLAAGQARRRGGSTISQQVAKNLFLSNSRSYARKAQELLITLMLEAVMSKRRILELYLNIAQWGRTSFGAQAAAQKFFRTDARKISAAQAANLAARLPRPAYYEQHGNTAWLRRHSATLRARLRQVQLP